MLERKLKANVHSREIGSVAQSIEFLEYWNSTLRCLVSIKHQRNVRFQGQYCSKTYLFTAYQLFSEQTKQIKTKCAAQ